MRAVKSGFNFGKGVILNGTSQYIQITNMNAAAFPVNGSYLILNRLNSFSISSMYPVLFESCENTASKNLFLYNLDFTANVLRQSIQIYDNASSQIINNQAVVSLTKTLSLYVVTWEQVGISTVVKLYYNGAFQTSASATTSSRPASFFTNSYIGVDRLFAGRYAPITVGEARLFNFTLTDAQITAYWNKGKGSNTLDSLSHFFWLPFNGNTTDLSGNSRNGTLIGSPTYLDFTV